MWRAIGTSSHALARAVGNRHGHGWTFLPQDDETAERRHLLLLFFVSYAAVLAMCLTVI